MNVGVATTIAGLSYFAYTQLREKRHKIVKELVKDCFFNVAVDLGCGAGRLGRLVRDNVGYLIGVDHNEHRLRIAEKREVYDELVLYDLRGYVPPSNTEAVFMLEVLEHLSKEDGLSLLKRLQNVPVIILTTPSKFSPISFKNGHISYWMPDDLALMGLDVFTYKRSILMEAVYGKGLIGVKVPYSWENFDISSRIRNAYSGMKIPPVLVGLKLIFT